MLRIIVMMEGIIKESGRPLIQKLAVTLLFSVWIQPASQSPMAILGAIMWVRLFHLPAPNFVALRGVGLQAQGEGNIDQDDDTISLAVFLRLSSVLFWVDDVTRIRVFKPFKPPNFLKVNADRGALNGKKNDVSHENTDVKKWERW